MIKGHSLDTGEGLVVWLTRSFRNFVSTPLEREYWGLMNEEAPRCSSCMLHPRTGHPNRIGPPSRSAIALAGYKLH